VLTERRIRCNQVFSLRAESSNARWVATHEFVNGHLAPFPHSNARIKANPLVNLRKRSGWLFYSTSKPCVSLWALSNVRNRCVMYL